MSGMPGLASSFEDGGMGFDYRLAMGIPDYWIRIIKEKRDEDWHPTSIYRELTNRRYDEKTVSYCESHDQALVGDKTIIFRLIDKEMYWHMMVGDNNGTVARGMALHKMIRLVTLALINGGDISTSWATNSDIPSGLISPRRKRLGFATNTPAVSGTSSTARI